MFGCHFALLWTDRNPTQNSSPCDPACFAMVSKISISHQGGTFTWNQNGSKSYPMDWVVTLGTPPLTPYQDHTETKESESLCLSVPCLTTPVLFIILARISKKKKKKTDQRPNLALLTRLQNWACFVGSLKIHECRRLDAGKLQPFKVTPLRGTCSQLRCLRLEEKDIFGGALMI